MNIDLWAFKKIWARVVFPPWLKNTGFPKRTRGFMKVYP